VRLDNQNISTVTISGTTTPVSGIGVNFTISTYPAGAEGQELTIISTRTNQNGQATTQLRLGNIPAGYGVTAFCPSCVPEANSVIFTCCGKLKTDDFKQFDERWAYDLYNTTSPTYQKTIGQVGCALSSLATLINYYSQIFPELNIPLTNPKDLNMKLLPNGFNIYHDVDFESVSSIRISSGHLMYISTSSLNYALPLTNTSIEEINNTLVKYLNQNMPIIVRVYRSKMVYNSIKGVYERKEWRHFMLVVGKCGDKFIVSDPGSLTRWTIGVSDIVAIDTATQDIIGPIDGVRVFSIIR